MTKVQAVTRYLDDNTTYLKALPEPFAMAIVSVLGEEDDSAWWRAIRTYDKRPAASPDWIEETGRKLKKAVKM